MTHSYFARASTLIRGASSAVLDAARLMKTQIIASQRRVLSTAPEAGTSGNGHNLVCLSSIEGVTSKLYFNPEGNSYDGGERIARKELIEQLDALRSQARGLFILFAFVFILIGIPFVIYDIRLVRLVRAHSPLRVVLPLGLGLFAAWALAALFCIVVLNRFVARRAPACPECSKRITWRERNAVLASGKCPHCDFRLFRI